MEPKTESLVTKQNSTLEMTIQVYAADGVTPLDISGWTAKMEIRKSKDSTSTLLAGPFSTNPGGFITVSGPFGQVLVDVPDETVDAFTWVVGYWDLYVTDPSGKKYCLAQGQAINELKITA
jgi:hypothetical protein